MEKEYNDMTIQCKDCGEEFVWKAGEQRFYEEKGLQAPVRCKSCRATRKAHFEEMESNSEDEKNDEFEKILESWKNNTVKF